MTPRSTSLGHGLLIAAGIIFGGLAVTLYAMRLSEAAVVPTIGAVAAAVVSVIKASSGPSGPADEDGGETAAVPAPDSGPALPASRETSETDAHADAPVPADTEVTAR